MKLVIVGFLLALSASFVLAIDWDLQGVDEDASNPALNRVRRSRSESKCHDHDDDDDDDDDKCCENGCDEDYFYEMVLRFEDEAELKNLNLGRVIVNEKDCEEDDDKSKDDSRSGKSRSRSRSHSSDSSDSSD